MKDLIIKKILGYFARRSLKRWFARFAIMLGMGVMAAAQFVQTPEGQALLASYLGPYAWALPVVVLLIGVMTNGKGKDDAPEG